MTKRLFMIAALWLFSTPVFALSPVQEVSSAKGIKAWLIEDHTNPIVALRFSFRGGAALDPLGKEGLARLAASTMDEGAGPLSSQAFQSRLEEQTITLRFDASMDAFGGQILSLKEDLNDAAYLLKLALTQPRFDAEPVNRIRSQILSGLRQAEEDPDSVGAKALYKAMFGNHPYARGSKGTINGINAVTQADLKTFVKQRLALSNLVVGVSGDITPDELEKLLDRIFANLPAKDDGQTVADVEPVFNTPLSIIEKAVPQSAVLFAQKGIDRHDPDFYPVYVLNYILGGGGFSSRLYEEVREKRGLVYSIYSYLANYDHANIWLLGSGTQNARVKETLDVVRAEWKKAAEKGVTREEVENAKTYLSGSFPLRFSSSDRIASILVGMQSDGLPIDFLEIRNEQVEAVTWEDVNRVAKSLLTPEKLQAVVVGQPEGLE